MTDWFGNSNSILRVYVLLNANQMQDNYNQYFMKRFHIKGSPESDSKSVITADKDNYFQEFRRSNTPKMRSISSGDSKGITILPCPFSFILKLTLAENILFR